MPSLPYPFRKSSSVATEQSRPDSIETDETILVEALLNLPAQEQDASCFTCSLIPLISVSLFSAYKPSTWFVCGVFFNLIF